jgi:DNA-directed RNA polymerase subunit RPC12/RpoP
MNSEYSHFVECAHCGAENGTDPIHEGETYRATTCTECGEWFTIYSED